EIRESFGIGSRFLNEIPVGSSVFSLLKEEAAKRWVRGVFIEPFRLMLIMVGSHVLWRTRRPLLLLALSWISAQFVALWLRIPKDTWYQTAYVALPLALLGALIISECGVGGRAGASRRFSRARIVTGLVCLAFGWGLVLVSLYGLTAVLQWRERSLDNLILAL